MLDTSQTDETLLEVSNVEVIYNHVILVLKWVSLKVLKVALLRFWAKWRRKVHNTQVTF